MRIRIEGRDLPGRMFAGCWQNVHVAVQRGKEPWEPVAGDAAAATWDFEVDDRLRGPFAQGKPGDKFLYLTWGDVGPDGSWGMFRRAKLHFADVPEEVLATGSIVGRLGLTDAKGWPLCARVRPPVIEWSAG